MGYTVKASMNRQYDKIPLSQLTACLWSGHGEKLIKRPQSFREQLGLTD